MISKTSRNQDFHQKYHHFLTQTLSGEAPSRWIGIMSSDSKTLDFFWNIPSGPWPNSVIELTPQGLKLLNSLSRGLGRFSILDPSEDEKNEEGECFAP